MHTTNRNSHTFTSYPFIPTKRSTLLLALHPFYSKLASTHSPHHSPLPLPPSQTIQFHTLPIHTPKPTKQPISFNLQFNYPSLISLFPFQHPFNNHHPSASNHSTSHFTITGTLPQTHNTLPLPFANPSLTLPSKKENTTHALPFQHFTTPLHSKESKAMHLYNLTIHKPSVVQRSIYGWRRLR